MAFAGVSTADVTSAAENILWHNDALAHAKSGPSLRSG
jgi:hypothetical protein